MMPVSEDELDSRIHSSMSQNNDYRYSALSKAEQRKVWKKFDYYLIVDSIYESKCSNSRVFFAADIRVMITARELQTIVCSMYGN